MNLDDWLAMAGATLTAAQELLHTLGTRADELRNQRGDSPRAFADLVVPKA